MLVNRQNILCPLGAVNWFCSDILEVYKPQQNAQKPIKAKTAMALTADLGSIKLLQPAVQRTAMLPISRMAGSALTVLIMVIVCPTTAVWQVP